LDRISPRRAPAPGRTRSPTASSPGWYGSGWPSAASGKRYPAWAPPSRSPRPARR